MAQVLPDALRVEIGYGSTPLTALSSVFWTDVTSSVRMSEGVSFNRGRFGNDALARPGSLSFTLDNGAQAGAAGRFTSGGSKVELRLPVRIRARYPFVTNMVANPSFETNTADWSTNGAGTTVTRVTTDFFSGVASASVARNASAGSGIFSSIMSVVAGQSYTASVYLKSPSGSGTFSVGIGVNWTAGGVFVSSSGPSSVTLTAGAAWQRVSVTGTAPATADGCRITVYTQSAGTAGHTFLVDAVQLEEGASASTFQTAVSSGRSSLWVGYVESVAAGWDGGYRPVVRVSASDRLARLEKRKLPSLVRGVQLEDAPAALWSLTDSAGSSSAGDVSGNTVTSLSVRSVGSDGSLDFGAADLGPGPDDVSCAVFTPSSTTVGKYLFTRSPGPWEAATSATTHEAYFYVTAASGSYPILWIDTDNAYNNVWIRYTGNRVQVEYSIESAGAALGSDPPLALDTWHHILLTQSLSGSTLTMKAYLNGVEIMSDAFTLASGPMRGPRLYVGYDETNVFSGRISHVAWYSSVLSATRIAEHAAARYTLNSFDAQTASSVFNRICDIAGLASTEYQVAGTTVATLSPVPVANAGLLQAAELVATAENGTVYLNRSGVLTLAARSTRHNPTSAFSIPAKCVDRGTSFSTDMSYMVNDVTVKRPAGITTRYVNTTSTAAYDTHDANIEAYLATDNQAQELASRLARVNATPAPRVSDIKVDLVTGAADLDESAILTADVGTYFQVTSLPTGSPAATLHLFVEGMQHEVTDSAWQVTMTTTPASEGFYRNVWKLGDASLSQLGSTTVLAF